MLVVIKSYLYYLLGEGFKMDINDFSRAFTAFKNQSTDRIPLWEDRYPCLNDTGDEPFDAHYIYHTAWAARQIAQIKPIRHVDISSILYFSTIVSAFVPVEHYDFRVVGIGLDGLKIGTADLIALPFADNSIESLSCLHSVEHVGLGRYGDALDPNGDRKAMSELCRVLAVGGQLLFVVPVGKSKICFNAHRIYSSGEVFEGLKGLTLTGAALVPDCGGLIINPSMALMDSQGYGCGCFAFKKVGL